MKSIYLNLNGLEHDLNKISNGINQVLQDVGHRLTLRKGDYIFDETQGVDYDIVFGKGYDTEQKISHIQSIILQNESISDVTLIKLTENTNDRILELEYELLLNTNEIVRGGATIGT